MNNAHADSRFAPGASWIDLHGPTVDIANMKVLLQQSFGFQDIHVLEDTEATRSGILKAIDELVSDTQSGDLVVFYYSGHGSLRLDSLSSKNHLDETIVPADAWKGTEDVRDKELALRFDNIVYGKHAHLTAIFDTCHSGTMARGITNSVRRVLPFDDRDVAEEKKHDPSTVTEQDLKQIPQNGDAIIIASAEPSESAVEALYPDDRQYHGAFTRALVRILRSSNQPLSANDLVAEISNVLHADPIPYQQPSVEGRTNQTLFGDPVAAHTLHVHIAKTSGLTVTIDMGSAAGFDVGTQFTAIEALAGEQNNLVEVTRIDSPLLCTARVLRGHPAIGQTFELTKMTYPHSARLVIFAPESESSQFQTVAASKEMFPGLTWVDDPTTTKIDFIVLHRSGRWIAYNRTGQIAPDKSIKGVAFLLLGPSYAIRSELENSLAYQQQAFTFTDEPGIANYLLSARLAAAGTTEYAFIDPSVLSERNLSEYVHSPENDSDEAAIVHGIEPEVVCRNNTSLPVRSAWLPDLNDKHDAVARALTRRIIRLGKLMLWLQSPTMAPGLGDWPYHLTVTNSDSDDVLLGMLHSGQRYDLRLVAVADQRNASAITPKYVYLFGFDCAGDPFLLYPAGSLNGDAAIPQTGPDGHYPISVKLAQEQVSTPLGADTVVLMATAEKLIDPTVVIRDSILDRRTTRGVTNNLENLITRMNDSASRGSTTVPTNWVVQQLLVPSR